jgi:hypothetical protein
MLDEAAALLAATPVSDRKLLNWVSTHSPTK